MGEEVVVDAVVPEGRGIDSYGVGKGLISSLYNARKIPLAGM